MTRKNLSNSSAVWGRLALGRAAGQDGAGQDGKPAGRFAQETTQPLAIWGVEHNCHE